MNIDSILDLVVTQKDKQDLLNFLEEIHSAQYRDGGVMSLISEDKKYGPTLLTILPEDFEKIDHSRASLIINNLIQSIKDIARVEILLATPPTENMLKEINEFIKNKTSKRSALDIKIDPAILGGVVFMIDGKYIDLSVSKKLNGAFEGGKMQELLNNSKGKIQNAKF